MLELEQATLSERFQVLLEQEQKAEQAYAGLAAQASDDESRRELRQIQREKLRHVQLVERLIEIVE